MVWSGPTCLVGDTALWAEREAEGTVSERWRQRERRLGKHIVNQKNVRVSPEQSWTLGELGGTAQVHERI